MAGSQGDGVSPTARWIARGIWKAALVIALFLLVTGIVEAVR